MIIEIGFKQIKSVNLTILIMVLSMLIFTDVTHLIIATIIEIYYRATLIILIFNNNNNNTFQWVINLLWKMRSK